MESHEGLLYDIDDEGVATITLDRPQEGNALTVEMHRALRRVWRDVDENPAVRVAIVTGAG